MRGRRSGTYPDVDLELASDHLRKPCPNDICSKLSLCYSQLSLCSMLQLLQSSRRSSQQHGSASLRKPCPNDICSKLSLFYSQLSLCFMLQLLQSSRRSSQQHGSASCAGYFLSMSAERLALNFTPANPKTMTTPPRPTRSFCFRKQERSWL